MNLRTRRKIAMMAAAASLAMSTNVQPIHAGVSLPPTGEATKGENQPFQHGYRVLEIENWSPESDPYAELLRAHVPLQERIDSFAPTQANPNLNPETSLTNLNGDYGNSFFDSTSYTNEFSQYAYNFWQYTDYYGGWHGMAVEGVPFRLYADDLQGGQNGFEFGILNLPNPAYTNAAHKNGTKSIGCLFIPRTGQPYDALLKQDENGNYVIAEKLIEIKEYFGFDGYFINQETSVDPSHIVKYKEFTKALVDAGVYTQWYDCIDDVQGRLTYKPSLLPSHSSFVYDQTLGRVNDSIFMNYNWNSPDGWNNGDSTNQAYINATVAEADRIGINPLDSVLMGVEFAMGKFSGSHNSTRNMDVICDEDGNPMAGIALFTPDYVISGLDDDLGDGSQNRRGEDDYQWMVAERERMLYTGVTIDPLDVGEKPNYSRPDVGIKDASQWGGVSKYITERSVIDGTTFVTNFNTGHGMSYYVDGQLSSTSEWSNMNIQDILPTWQWWIDTEGSKLQADFDYGPTVEQGDKFTYEQVGAYQGGSSLVVNGTLDSDNFLRLFKTDLEVTPSTKAHVTFNKLEDSEDAEMKLGLVFKDAPDTVEYIEIDNTDEATNGWETEKLNLSKYKGREIAVIGLGFSSEDNNVIKDYQINIGEIQITDNKNYTPSRPSGFEIIDLFDTGEAYVKWNMEDYSKVKQYNLYAETDTNDMQYLGGTYDDVFYIKNLPSGTEQLLLTAVGADGSEGKPAVIELSDKGFVQSLDVTTTPSAINVSWETPDEKLSGVKVELALGQDKRPVFTETFDQNTTSTSITIEPGEGQDYLLRLSTIGRSGKVINTVSKTGRTQDTYSAPYSGNFKVVNRKLVFDTPTSKDWWHMYIEVDGVLQKPSRPYGGKPVDYRIRGFHDFNDISAPNYDATITVILEDYEGNLSELTYLEYRK